MLLTHSRDALAFARERACRLREETAIDQLGQARRTGRSVAATLLRHAADRLDPTSLADRIA